MSWSVESDQENSPGVLPQVVDHLQEDWSSSGRKDMGVSPPIPILHERMHLSFPLATSCRMLGIEESEPWLVRQK